MWVFGDTQDIGNPEYVLYALRMYVRGRGTGEKGVMGVLTYMFHVLCDCVRSGGERGIRGMIGTWTTFSLILYSGWK